MSSLIFSTPASASPLAVDTDSPNTTEPSELRTFHAMPLGRDGTATAAYAVAIGGAVTLQLWTYMVDVKRWCKIGTATACAEDTLTQLGTPPIGADVLYAQVTENSACTRFGIGLIGTR